MMARAQGHMREHGVDAWLVYDYRGSNPVMAELLGDALHLTRRIFYVIPVAGLPQLLVHTIEASLVGQTNSAAVTYCGHRSMMESLGRLLAGMQCVAMEYSPGGLLPTMSWVDGGTLDMVRGFQVEVVSSADLFQHTVGGWSPATLESHQHACGQVAEVRDAAFEFVSQRLGAGSGCTEYEVQEMMMQEFEGRGLEAGHPPIVAVNAHSGNPHYAPGPEVSGHIGVGDWLLVDLWARRPGRQHVYADITWVAFAGPVVRPQHKRVFDIVRGCRDLVVADLQKRWRDGRSVQGWELDAAARAFIAEAGYGEHFPHRVGHSLSPGPAVHGLGANLDDLETHDTRQILPGTGFTVEPGIYLPEFGVRLEIDVYVDPQSGPTVTTDIQEEVVLL